MIRRAAPIISGPMPSPYATVTGVFWLTGISSSCASWDARTISIYGICVVYCKSCFACLTFQQRHGDYAERPTEPGGPMLIARFSLRQRDFAVCRAQAGEQEHQPDQQDFRSEDPAREPQGAYLVASGISRRKAAKTESSALR